jgi:rhodanese-related sulfurtransferase
MLFIPLTTLLSTGKLVLKSLNREKNIMNILRPTKKQVIIAVFIILGLAAYILLPGGGYRDISPGEAKRRLDSGEPVILLDVRTPAEHFALRIPNSLLIPVDEIETLAPSLLPDKNAVIFVYCRSGRRSVTASLALVRMGYSKVYNLGGIIDWPYETESGYE